MNLEGLVRSATGNVFHADGSDITNEEWAELAEQSEAEEPELDISNFRAYIAGLVPLGDEA